MGCAGDFVSLLGRVQAVAAQLDDDALSALANRGLVRRARKDVEAMHPSAPREVDGTIELTVEQSTVRLTERPIDSMCSCPATGVCRHILAAWIHLATHAPAPASTETAGHELLAVSDDELRRWAGTALLRRAERELATGLTVELIDGSTFVARFPEWNVECRWLAGGGLAGMLCSCHSTDACVHRVAAVLAWQVQRGARELSTDEAMLESSAGAPRTRDEVRLAVIAAAEDTVIQGLSRLSPATVERLRTLATSAHGLDLPRLERAVRAWADELAAWLERSARASEELLLTRTATAYALAHALAHPTPALVGQHQSRYERVRELDLIGVGARAWYAASGYRGLTAYFWDTHSKTWCTWTDARPVTLATFDPAARFTAAGPWSGCESPAVASTSRVRLRAAWRSRNGRISGRPSTAMTAVGSTRADDLPIRVRRWSDLSALLRTQFIASLGDRLPSEICVVLAPSSYERAVFDEIEQELRVPLVDDTGAVLPLVLPHSEENRRAIAELEALTLRPGMLVFGLLHLRRGDLSVTPVSIIDAESVLSLGFGASNSRSAGTSVPLLDDEADTDDDFEQADHLTDSSDAVGRLTSSAWSELEAIATLGIAAYRDWARIRAIADSADSLGLNHASHALRGIAADATNETDRLHAGARATLGAAWLLRLTQAAAAVSRVS
jgi:hypothetical protein